MIDEKTSWPRLYGIAALIGAGFGLLLSLGAMPSVPEWPNAWSAERISPVAAVLLTVAGGTLVGVLFAGAAHLGVRYQLRRRE